MATDPLPKTIGPYRVEAELGRGMMGVVYRARKGRDRKAPIVALKVIRMAFAVSEEQRVSFERRFLEEARIVSRLSHPAIVGVYDMGRDAKEGAAYIAFELLEGRNLAAILAEGPPLDWRETLRIVARVAEALHYAHGKGVVHRDIKPANIMIQPSGEPKIMDFGLAKLEEGLELTSTGQFLGTPLYMAPEQALGGRVDGRTDLFSLGSVAYTLLTGRRAFEAESVPQVLNRVTYQHPPAPTKLVPSLPADVDYLVARSMTKSKDDRYPDGRTMADDVQDVLQGRAPRHRKGWRLPDVGEGTHVAARPRTAAPDAEELELVLEPVAAAPRRRRGSGPVAVLGLSMLALGVVLYSSAFWREQLAGWLRTSTLFPPVPVAEQPRRVSHSAESSAPALPAPSLDEGPTEVVGAIGSAPLPGPGGPASPSPEDSPEPDDVLDAAPSPLPDGETAAAGEAAQDEDPAPDSALEEEAGGEAPSPPPGPAPAPPPVPSPEPPPRPEPSPSARARTVPPATPRPSAAPRPAPATSRLSITLEHHLKSGTVRVWVDRKLVLEERLTSRVTKDLLVFKLRAGKVQDVLPVVPGRRRVRVEVRDGGETRAKEITGTFKAGATRRLEVKVGRMSGGLSLAWK